jgi:hypothetical protein
MNFAVQEKLRYNFSIFTLITERNLLSKKPRIKNHRLLSTLKAQRIYMSVRLRKVNGHLLLNSQQQMDPPK